MARTRGKATCIRRSVPCALTVLLNVPRLSQFRAVCACCVTVTDCAVLNCVDAQALIYACSAIVRDNKYPPNTEVKKLVNKWLVPFARQVETGGRVPGLPFVPIPEHLLRSWEGSIKYSAWLNKQVRIKRNAFGSAIRKGLRAALPTLVGDYLCFNLLTVVY